MSDNLHICRCGSQRFAAILARVPDDLRIPIGKALHISYGLGPGSGLALPMTLCLNCGTIQGHWPIER